MCWVAVLLTITLAVLGLGLLALWLLDRACEWIKRNPW